MGIMMSLFDLNENDIQHAWETIYDEFQDNELIMPENFEEVVRPEVQRALMDAYDYGYDPTSAVIDQLYECADAVAENLGYDASWETNGMASRFWLKKVEPVGEKETHDEP